MGIPVHETPDDVWKQMFDLNTGFVINVARAIVPHMPKAGKGVIVNVAAMAALKGGVNMAAYTVSKSAVVRLTESMAAELESKGIRVNCVLPSTMDTPANRADMPDVDPATWVAPSAVADGYCLSGIRCGKGCSGRSHSC